MATRAKSKDAVTGAFALRLNVVPTGGRTAALTTGLLFPGRHRRALCVKPFTSRGTTVYDRALVAASPHSSSAWIVIACTPTTFVSMSPPETNPNG